MIFFPLDPHTFADPDPGSQNFADPDPKHWFKLVEAYNTIYFNVPAEEDEKRRSKFENFKVTIKAKEGDETPSLSEDSDQQSKKSKSKNSKLLIAWKYVHLKICNYSVPPPFIVLIAWKYVHLKICYYSVPPPFIVLIAWKYVPLKICYYSVPPPL